MAQEKNGYVYKPRYKATDGTYRESAVWWMQFFNKKGKRERESTGETNETKARVKLAERIRDRDLGLAVGGQVTRTTFADLERFILSDYRRQGFKSKDRLERSLGHLRGYFEGFKVQDIDKALIDDYTDYRQEREGASNATVNRELSALKRAFRLAAESGRVRTVPIFSKLTENNARKGFFEDHHAEAVFKRLPAHIEPLMRAALITGWRTNSELCTRQWRHVDFEACTMRLEPGETKNGEGRTFYFEHDEELTAILLEQHKRSQSLGKELGCVVPWVFFRPDGTELNKNRYATQWNKACEEAQVHGRTPHDFRRTTVRNMNRAGIVQSTAMEVTGHITPSVYKRYSINDEESLKEAVKKAAERRGSTLAAARRKKRNQ